MARRAEVDLHDALAEYGQRVVEHHGQRLEFAQVIRAAPKLVVELEEGQESLTEDAELILPPSLRQDARQLAGGNDDPDTVVVSLMGDSRYLVVSLISDRDTPDRPTTDDLDALTAKQGGARITAGTPPVVHGQSGGVAGVARQAAGITRVTFSFDVDDVSHLWCKATVEDSTAATASVMVVSASPAVVDVYTWSAAGAALDKTFHLDWRGA